MNGLEFREAIGKRGFVYLKDLDVWKGPNGCMVSDLFITEVDDFHTSNVQGQMLMAIDAGAKHICAVVTEVRPYKVEVLFK